MSNEVELTGIPETMLWTLHNRAAEATRSGGILHDPDCVRIYDSIAYDYQYNFGKPDGTHAQRARIFDDAVCGWLAENPSGTVVELGAGLETQFQRCDNGAVKWVCVDVEESIAVRERFLPAGPRCRHIACSALDLAWLDHISPGPVFITAQGLFMYFDEPDVRTLVTAIVGRLPGVQLMFDAIPPWFSRKTMKGFAKTRNYTAPPMPWGSNATASRRSCVAGVRASSTSRWVTSGRRAVRSRCCCRSSSAHRCCATSRRSSPGCSPRRESPGLLRNGLRFH